MSRSLSPGTRSIQTFSCLRPPTRPHAHSPWCHARFSSPHFRAYATTVPVRRFSTFRNVLAGTSIALGLGFGYFYATDTRASVHKWLVVPLIRTIWPDAEDAHVAGVYSLRALSQWGLHPRERGELDASGDLGFSVFGHTLDNPMGISSGLDKNGIIPSQLFGLGAAVVEIGGVAPQPQAGNPRPRVFRLKSQEALINRCGMNSEGATSVAARLRRRVWEYGYRHGYDVEEVLNGDAGVPPGSLVNGKLLAIQVAKQETTPVDDIEAIKADYVSGTKALAPYADVIVVNVSCPNARYRELQQAGPLANILTGVVEAARQTPRKVKPFVMLKVSPDEDGLDQVQSVCKAVWDSGVDGIVVGNTTKKRLDPVPSRPAWTAAEQQTLREQGGFSGPHLFKQTVSLVKMYRENLDAASYRGSNSSKEAVEAQPGLDTAVTPPKPSTHKVLWATGGITSSSEALEVLNAGASVAMVYTAMVYGGSGTITRIKQDMRQELKESLKSR